MKVAISQPRYLPALNYLQRILISDTFVILDSVQHQRRAYEHRNKIKSVNGRGTWCSIPLKKNSSRPVISELEIIDSKWVEKHKNTITQYYKNAAYFDRDVLDYIYQGVKCGNFVENIMKMTVNICELLDINYNFKYASDLKLSSSGDQLLYDITKTVGGNEYISGPNGRNYIDKKKFYDIKLTFHEYNFPRYRQLYGEFVPWMSVVDQIFNVGIEETKDYIFDTPVFKDT